MKPSTFELVVAGRQLDNGDVAIMMVEAGGTEKSFAYYADGAPKVDEAVLAGGLEACKVWIKESIALQRQLVASVIATNGPITPLPFSVLADYSPDVLDAVAGCRHRRRWRTPSPSAARPSATPPPTRATAQAIDQLCAARAPRSTARSRDQGGRPQPDQEAGPQAHRRRGPAHRRSWSPRPAPAVVRGRRAADGSWHWPVPARRDAGDERRHPGHADA